MANKTSDTNRDIEMETEDLLKEDEANDYLQADNTITDIEIHTHDPFDEEEEEGELNEDTDKKEHIQSDDYKKIDMHYDMSYIAFTTTSEDGKIHTKKLRIPYAGRKTTTYKNEELSSISWKDENSDLWTLSKADNHPDPSPNHQNSKISTHRGTNTPQNKEDNPKTKESDRGKYSEHGNKPRPQRQPYRGQNYQPNRGKRNQVNQHPREYNGHRNNTYYNSNPSYNHGPHYQTNEPRNEDRNERRNEDRNERRNEDRNDRRSEGRDRPPLHRRNSSTPQRFAQDKLRDDFAKEREERRIERLMQNRRNQ